MKQEKGGKATGWHFNKKGHSVHDMMVSILEKVHTRDELQREERESMEREREKKRRIGST